MSTPLKAGTLDDFSASLASYMNTAMANEWLAVKGEVLPTSGPGVDDRKILFAAVAQGMMKFLADNLANLITSTDSAGAGPTTHHHTMAFSVDTYRDPLP